MDIKIDPQDLLKNAIYSQCDADCWQNDDGEYYSVDYSKRPYTEGVCQDCNGKGRILTNFGKDLISLMKEVFTELKDIT